MIAGRIVQISSIICSSIKYRLIILLKNKFSIKYLIKKMIKVKIIRVESWKKIICSIRGEFLFWKFRLVQVAISKKRNFFIIGV